ncbi:3 5-cyclic nucleotide phosphodiesterase family protein [Stylonychia lemnae]|uniref:3 5-cyclic nucleotide phosphodiesterase family protein n=1 Tax=Stylonychia lemnae TaxID=5949 RepID=A0A078BA73_STYLE|nr:3 5-cyclic nucleotide phosphodiesterase family protein [Stylonychia lemnae]|eukprot:CDW90418.1 3 5-cyclic nucleotide phosphodiesterase family protein [Stylonychia lemnae]
MSESRQHNLAIQTNTLNVNKYSEPGQDEYSTNSTNDQQTSTPTKLIKDKELKKNKITVSRNYLLMDKVELEKNGIIGWKLNLAMLLRSKAYDLLMIILIVLYTILIFIYFAFADTYFSDESNQVVFYIIELSILGIFCVEIGLHLIAFKSLYLKDFWNIFDLFIIILSLTFVLLDIFVENSVLDGILKIRGIFRLLRVFLLVRKLNTLRVKRQIQLRQLTANGYDLRSPLERVLEILNGLRDQLDIEETKIIQDLNYCIKVISSNQLYEANLDFDGQLENTKDRNEVQMLLQNYSKVANENQEQKKQRRMSKSPTIGGLNHWDDSKFQITNDKIDEMLVLNEQAKAELENLQKLEFNIFKIQDYTQQNELITVTSYILAQQNIFQTIQLQYKTFRNFISKVQSGYKDVTYHNKTHAADLSQTFYYFSHTQGLKEKCNIDDVEFFSLIVAGACHDHEHAGYNNVYLVETQDTLALRYNDVSVLENHHVASSFAIMQEPGMNILAHLSKEQYKRSRAVMIGSILGTDMSKHFSELGKFKTRVGSQEFDPSGTDKDLTLTMLFHLADISNSTKPWDICQKWIDLLFIEFFHQGDLERNRGSPISYLMDRLTVNIAKAQIGFLDVIIAPSYQAANLVIPIPSNLSNIENNKATWQTKFDEYEDQMNRDKERFKLTALKL